MSFNYREIPKIDLHHHFDGSFTAEELYAEAQRRKLPQGDLTFEEFSRRCRVQANCRTLTDFLAVFSFFYEIAQDLKFQRQAAESLVRRLKEDGLVYAETRFAPHLLVPPGCHLEETVEAVLTGLREGCAHENFTVNLILCIMRGVPVEQGWEVLKLVQKYRGHGVVGIDLAGDESRYRGDEYIRVFQEAAAQGISITVHAGEGAGAVSVDFAIKQLKAQRIGHGIRSKESEEVMHILQERQIPLEICLTSNIQTGTVESLKEHPIMDFLNRGLCVTLNTDDPSVSGITLSHEWQIAHETYGLSLVQMEKLLLNSVYAAFCSQEEKCQLEAKIKDYFGSLGKVNSLRKAPLSSPKE
ncbi:MAG: adenosine deaminase [Leptospiraceae bacterium]|nr:adenosine deaminase [Leptospiraceae bacterium]MDW8306161.1 adenosine deaminase [Leptospiraceae bacterium]